MPPRRRASKSPPRPPRGVLWTPEEEESLRDVIKSLPRFVSQQSKECEFSLTPAEWLEVARTMEGAHAMNNASSVSRREYSKSRGVQAYMQAWDSIQRRQQNKLRAGSEAAAAAASTSAQAAGHVWRSPKLRQYNGSRRAITCGALLLVVVAGLLLQLPQPPSAMLPTRRAFGEYFPSVAARFRLNQQAMPPAASFSSPPPSAAPQEPPMYTPDGHPVARAPPRPPPPEDDHDDDEILCDCTWTSVAGQSCRETDGKEGFPCWPACCS